MSAPRPYTREQAIEAMREAFDACANAEAFAGRAQAFDAQVERAFSSLVDDAAKLLQMMEKQG